MVDKYRKCKYWILFSKILLKLRVTSSGGWGGRTKANVGSLSPPMEFGHFPDGNKVHGFYFRSLEDSREFTKSLYAWTFLIKAFSDNTNCYGVYYYKDHIGVYDEGVIQFGGPGGKCEI